MDSLESAAAGADTSVGLRAGPDRRSNHSAVGDDKEVAVGELLLESVDQVNLDRAVSVDLGDRDEEGDGLAVGRNLEVLGGAELQSGHGLGKSIIARGNLLEGTSDLELQGVGLGVVLLENERLQYKR